MLEVPHYIIGESMRVNKYSDFIRDGVKLVLEEEEGKLEITYADLSPTDVYHLVILLVGRLSDMTGQGYNDTLDDLKETGEI